MKKEREDTEEERMDRDSRVLSVRRTVRTDMGLWGKLPSAKTGWRRTVLIADKPGYDNEYLKY